MSLQGGGPSIIRCLVARILTYRLIVDEGGRGTGVNGNVRLRVLFSKGEPFLGITT